MTDYKKLSELYALLDHFLRMKRDISEARENPQTKAHIFKLDVHPNVNSMALMASKLKHREQLLSIVDAEIEETQQNISQLSSEK